MNLKFLVKREKQSNLLLLESEQLSECEPRTQDSNHSSSSPTLGSTDTTGGKNWGCVPTYTPGTNGADQPLESFTWPCARTQFLPTHTSQPYLSSLWRNSSLHESHFYRTAFQQFQNHVSLSIVPPKYSSFFHSCSSGMAYCSHRPKPASTLFAL